MLTIESITGISLKFAAFDIRQSQQTTGTQEKCNLNSKQCLAPGNNVELLVHACHII